MRLVWLSHFVPYPPRGGSFQRTFNLLRHASETYETTFIALNLQNETPPRLEEYKGEFRKFCADVEFWEPPMKWKGGRWWAQLAVSPLYKHHYAARSLWSSPLEVRWRRVLDQHRGDLILFETVDLAPFFPASDGFPRVLNHQNCESAMAQRRAAKEQNPAKKAFIQNQAQKIAQTEKEWCPQFDTNLAVSDLDVALLRGQAPDAHFHLVENGTDTDYFVPVRANPEPCSLIFAGDLGWYPNISAILHFAREIWPGLRLKVPEIRLYLAGRNPAPAVANLAKDRPGMVLVPDPEDIRPWVSRAKVYVCPILDGGGTRLKILDALAMGMPVVTTSIGCEGLRTIPGEHLLVADTPSDFVHETLRLLGDEALARQLGTRGRTLVEEQYSWKMSGRQLLRAFDCARNKENCRDAPR